MSELPGTSAVGIEAVEWSSESGGNLTVRITGRWRRRRPATTGQPTLVIEANGRRHRFPAMPEPPSLAGTAPGVWRLSFAIPGWLAPDLGRTWLQLGTVVVTLPVAVPSPGEAAAPASGEPGEPAPTPEPEAPAAPAPRVAVDPEGPSEPERGSGFMAPSPSEPPPSASSGPPRGSAGPDVSALADRVAALEHELADARAGRDELAASLAERDRSRRIAEQRAHAEQALRRDLSSQLALSAQEAERTRQALGDLGAAEDRIRLLERELAQARRRTDETEQVAAAATAARERAEQRLDDAETELARRAAAGTRETARLHFEQELRELHADAAVWVPDEPVVAGVPGPAAPEPEPPPPPPAAPPPPPTPAIHAPAPEVLDGGLVATLRRELETRAAADAPLRARLVDAESRLAARVLLERRTTEALAQVRDELETLRHALTRERRMRTDAERRVAELERELGGQRTVSRVAYDAIGELRSALDELVAAEAAAARAAAAEARPAPESPPAPEPPPAPVTEPPPAAEAVAPRPEPTAEPPEPPVPAEVALTAPGLLEPARLNDALTRLRETIAPQEPGAGAVAARPPSLLEALGRPSLERAFRALLATDPDAAGRLVLELLPLQRVVYPHAISYDLALGPGRGCVCVSVPNGTVTIGVQSTPRPREEVDFQVYGDPAKVARLLTAGRFRRRFSRRVARVRGRREGVVALSALLGTPLDLRALHRAGIRLDPATALSLAAAMIDPAWTVRDRFTLAHVEPETPTTYLVVRSGQPILVTRNAPEGRITTTIECPADQLLAVLAGEPVSGLTVRGDEAPLAALRESIKRAQSE